MPVWSGHLSRTHPIHELKIIVGERSTVTPMAINRKRLKQGWVVASLAYGGLRVYLVWAFLRSYGVNPWIFLIVEMTSSLVLALSSSRMMGSIIDRRFARLCKWSPVVLGSYLAPDLYVFSRAGDMPNTILAAIVIVVVVMLGFTVSGTVLKLRQISHST